MALVVRAGWTEGHPWIGLQGRQSLQLLLGNELRLGIGPRRCIGFVEDGVAHACQTSQAPRGRQCGVCQQRDTFRPCMICDGFACPRLTPHMRARCDDVHHLYLASFGGPQVKVGTASRGREEARLVEQGPLAAVRIARGCGPRIKQMEHLLSTRTGLVEAVRRSQKLRLLSSGPDADRARDDVGAAVVVAHELLADDYAEELHPPEAFEEPALATRSRPLAVGRTVLPVQVGASVQGHVVGAVGPIALLDDDGARLLLDLGALVGHEVDLHPPDRLARPTVQLGLFA